MVWDVEYIVYKYIGLVKKLGFYLVLNILVTHKFNFVKFNKKQIIHKLSNYWSGHLYNSKNTYANQCYLFFTCMWHHL